jgi:hypothetical protein
MEVVCLASSLSDRTRNDWPTAARYREETPDRRRPGSNQTPRGLGRTGSLGAVGSISVFYCPRWESHGCPEADMVLVPGNNALEDTVLASKGLGHGLGVLHKCFLRRGIDPVRPLATRARRWTVN